MAGCRAESRARVAWSPWTRLTEHSEVPHVFLERVLIVKHEIHEILHQTVRFGTITTYHLQFIIFNYRANKLTVKRSAGVAPEVNLKEHV